MKLNVICTAKSYDLFTKLYYGNNEYDKFSWVLCLFYESLKRQYEIDDQDSKWKR